MPGNEGYNQFCINIFTTNTQYTVAVVQVEAYPASRQTLLQQAGYLPCLHCIVNIRFKNLYNLHEPLLSALAIHQPARALAFFYDKTHKMLCLRQNMPS